MDISTKRYVFEAKRHGRGWLYRRRWRGGEADHWKKTSIKWLAKWSDGGWRRRSMREVYNEAARRSPPGDPFDFSAISSSDGQHPPMESGSPC